MNVTRALVAQQLGAYLQGRLSLGQLVDWAEQAMQEGDFGSESSQEFFDLVARLGLADVRAFGLTWEECRRMFGILGVAPRLDLVPA